MTKVELKCTENGPIMVMVDGKTFKVLCRCGGSNNKPYCDGTHTRIGFKAEAKEIQIS
jgi:CDGSH-type Zn-finger protein